MPQLPDRPRRQRKYFPLPLEEANPTEALARSTDLPVRSPSPWRERVALLLRNWKSSAPGSLGQMMRSRRYRWTRALTPLAKTQFRWSRTHSAAGPLQPLGAQRPPQAVPSSTRRLVECHSPSLPPQTPMRSAHDSTEYPETGSVKQSVSMGYSNLRSLDPPPSSSRSAPIP